ncbi:MAG: hypothetical protein LIO85_09265 [Rikenellaceae bacterium]|nr:hypothetical protein [Rikenellaceae bacterium]
MRYYVFITFALLSCRAALGQEPTGLPAAPDSAVRVNPIEPLPEAMLPVTPLTLGPVEVPGQSPAFDDSGIRAMYRTVLSEIPRYPSVRLGPVLNAYPFLGSDRSRYMGLDVAGMGTRVDITEWLSADVSAFLSGAYIGAAYPGRYMNASVATTVRLKLHDRFYVTGSGQLSAREGLDPRIAPGFGGKNSLGAGVEIWITEKFGIGISHTWEHYRGGWHGQYGYGPIGR